jgi:ATP-dependent DNA helicase RecG
LEILNAGGLYGNARPENFPRVNDYRNPLIASAMKTMGYVNMFNRGVGQVQTDLKENGNPPAEFDVSLITAFRVDVISVASSKNNSYPIATNDVGDPVGDNVGDLVVDDIRNVVKTHSSQLSERQITIIELMFLNPSISAKEMSQKLSLTSRTIERDIAKIKKLGIVEREGNDHGGTWKVLVPNKKK